MLRNYQNTAIQKVFLNAENGIRKQIYQLPTGGGKSIIFSGLADQFLSKYYKSQVLIVVHRVELLKQCQQTFYKAFQRHSTAITAGIKSIPHSSIYVGMVETIFNRLKSNPGLFKNIGLLIVDEVHVANFNKLYEYFPSSLIVGVTATPIAASKKNPLRNYFDEIVCGPQIPELIKEKYLVPNITYQLKGINRKSLNIKRGEFDNFTMGKTFSNTRNVNNTVIAYEKHCENKKTLVFNVNIEHSKLVNNAFLNSGYNSKHLDGNETPDRRKEILKWFAVTDNAILNSVGILTMGFDEPSIINVIVNRATMSLPLWLQMTGRGSRLFENKHYFKIIDMGGNALAHGDWGAYRDWSNVFYFPDEPSKSKGVAPIKICNNCEAIIPAQSMTCEYCGFKMERLVNYDRILPDFELHTNNYNVFRQVELNTKLGAKEWKTFFDILNHTITILKYRIGDNDFNEEFIDKSWKIFESKVIEWRKAILKPYSRNVKEFAYKKFKDELFKIKRMVA